MANIFGQYYLIISIFICYSKSVNGQDPEVDPIPHHLTDKSYIWKTCETTDNPIVVTVDEGYFISVTASEVKMSDGNYLQIQGGDASNLEATDGRLFANDVAGPLKYLFKTSSVYASCNNAQTGDNTFNVKFERTGEPTTTVVTTTTTPLPVPTTDVPVSPYITVNVFGRSLAEFNHSEVKEAFQACVVGIAVPYCQEQNFSLQRNITNEYVMIAKINQCPYNWPHSEKCVQVEFKLPIFYDETAGYQLNSSHLELMWVRRHELDKNTCFTMNQFEDYDDPDFERSIVWWAVGITLVTVAFVILLWFFRTFVGKMKSAIGKRSARESDSVSILSRQTNSVCSLTPHYLQDHLDTPKFFET